MQHDDTCKKKETEIMINILACWHLLINTKQKVQPMLKEMTFIF